MTMTIPPLHNLTALCVRRRLRRIHNMKHQVRIYKVVVIICFRAHHSDFGYGFEAELGLVLEEEVCEDCAVRRA
jgi:hypothetical protein